MKTRLKLLLLMALCLLSVWQLQAQNGHSDADVLVNITVVDESGEPLPGASVKVAGKPVGVIANLDGTVSLWVPRDTHITVSYLEIARGQSVETSIGQFRVAEQRAHAESSCRNGLHTNGCA